MSETVIEVNNLSKKYHIGLVGAGSFADDMKRYWARILGKEDPTINIAHRNVLNAKTSLTDHDYVWALRDVNFEVKKGEVLGIIGKNGAGKSTLLKVLSKVTSPTKGDIKIKGRIASLLEVGTGFHSELTGRENIFLNGAILGMSKTEIKSKLEEIVDFSGIERFIDTPVKRYSSGMYVRLAFAVAAHLEPDILVLDEVLAVGDAEFQKKCLGKMKDVSEKDGRTVLFVSHNLTAISNLCTRAILLDKGALIANSGTSEVIEKYSNYNQTQNQKGIFEWEEKIAPGNENIKLKSICVLSNNSITYEVDIQDDFEIEIKYWNFKPNLKITVIIQITDYYGNIILSGANFKSTNLKEDVWFNEPMPVGLYRTTCHIKGQLLNVREYFVNIYFQKDVTLHEVILDNLISFNVTDHKGWCKEYSNIWSCFVRPKLEWETEKI